MPAKIQCANHQNFICIVNTSRPLGKGQIKMPLNFYIPKSWKIKIQWKYNVLPYCGMLHNAFNFLAYHKHTQPNHSVGLLLNHHTTNLINRDHSFSRHTEFWAKQQNLPISAEFLRFRGILRNSVLAGDKGTNTAYFGWFQAALDN